MEAVQKFCQACSCQRPHIEVRGDKGKISLECAHCLNVGQPNPVEAFSSEWVEQAASMAAA